MVVSFVLKTKEKLSLLYIWYICSNSCVSEAATKKLFYKIDNLWYRNRRSAKILWKSLALVKLVCVYNSTKGKFFLKYFMRKIIWKNTSNSSCLLLIFLNIVIRTFLCFLWLCSKELAVTLKCYYENANDTYFFPVYDEEFSK